MNFICTPNIDIRKIFSNQKLKLKIVRPLETRLTPAYIILKCYLNSNTDKKKVRQLDAFDNQFNLKNEYAICH